MFVLLECLKVCSSVCLGLCLSVSCVIIPVCVAGVPVSVFSGPLCDFFCNFS